MPMNIYCLTLVCLKKALTSVHRKNTWTLISWLHVTQDFSVCSVTAKRVAFPLSFYQFPITEKTLFAAPPLQKIYILHKL